MLQKAPYTTIPLFTSIFTSIQFVSKVILPSIRTNYTPQDHTKLQITRLQKYDKDTKCENDKC